VGLFTSFQLKSADAETRRRAALKLGVPGRRSSITALQPLLDDPEWRVREAAASALAAIAEAEAVPHLLHAIRASAEIRGADGAAAVRRASVAGLVAVGQPAVAPLIEALRDRDARLREAAIEALGGIGGADSAAALATAVGDDRSTVRQAAAPALARAGGPGAVPALRTALAHKDPATRRAAAAALGLLTDPAAAEALRACTGDRDRAVRDAAMHALAALGTSGAVDALCAALLEGDRDARASAVSALRSFEWTPTGSRQRAVLAVLRGRYGDAAVEGAEGVQPLLVALGDKEPAARRGAAEALGGVEDPRVLEALAPLLGDHDATVRDAAARSLARRGPAAAGELARALQDEGAAREAAARAIAIIGEGPVASALVAPLLAGQPGRHGGLTVRLLHDRDDMDEARRAADRLEALVAQLRARLPDDTLTTLATLEDVMLAEPGHRPDPDARVVLDELRSAAAQELEKRGAA
jgi:HEAT repeat protein